MKSSRAAVSCLLLSVLGLGLCVYLTVVHLALLRGELIGGIGCGASGTPFNCHAVTASPFGQFLGMPLSLWGLLGYLATAVLAFIAWQFSEWTSKALAAIATLSLIFLGIDAVLFVIMIRFIGYLCPVCLGTYAVNLGVLWCAGRACGKRPSELLRQATASLAAFRPQSRVAVAALLWGVLLTGSVGAFSVNTAARFFSEGPPGALRKQMTDFVKHQQRVQVGTSGDPRHGASGAPIQIVEFSDFLCPSCQRASQFNPLLLASSRGRAAFTFKHYPLDQTCNDKIQRVVHPNACQIAAATECAHEQGKFWALHDRLFGKLAGAAYPIAELERDAEAAGVNLTAFRECLQAGRGMDAVKRDIEEATRLGVRSTPTYVVNGLLMPGVLMPVAFNELLEVLQETK